MTGDPCPLTPRELDALRAMASTGGGKLAARRIGVRPCTLKNHLNAINHKLGTFSTTQAAVYAVERNWLTNVTIDGEGERT